MIINFYIIAFKWLVSKRLASRIATDSSEKNSLNRQACLAMVKKQVDQAKDLLLERASGFFIAISISLLFGCLVIAGLSYDISFLSDYMLAILGCILFLFVYMFFKGMSLTSTFLFDSSLGLSGLIAAQGILSSLQFVIGFALITCGFIFKELSKFPVGFTVLIMSVSFQYFWAGILVDRVKAIPLGGEDLRSYLQHTRPLFSFKSLRKLMDDAMEGREHTISELQAFQD